MPHMGFEEAIEYISGFQFHGFRLGLERMEAVLGALGHPHMAYPCVHVAGTNGKGSVCATLSQVLQQAGYRVGLYTSPHLHSLRERFRINGEEIPEEELSRQISRLRALVEKGYELSYFEYTTAIAFQWFREEGVDLAVIETGLGGRLDATNVVTPLVGIVTNIGLDHQAYLGNSLEEIAREKAGIIKREIPVVSGVMDEPARGILEEACRAASSRLRLLGRDFDLAPDPSGGFLFAGPGLEVPGIEPALSGRHQAANTALALAAAAELAERGLSIPPEAMQRGVKEVSWPGRSEFLDQPARCLLDGAHNLDGVRCLRDLVQDALPGRPRTLLWACSNEGGTKDFVAMLGEISPLFDSVIITEPPGPRAPVTVKQWKESLQGQGAVLERNWEAALEKALSLCGEQGALCVAGSLYLVGAVRARFASPGTPAG